ncbi:MAG: hypothetical protein JRI52_00015 [Deltaproteobacteria bacterium]|nr:hypothetical protein [Deltaproteobacteria bacterium]
MSYATIAAIAAPIVIGGIQAAVMGSKASDMENDVLNAQTDVDNAVLNRQDIYNAAEDIRGLKSELSNAYANLGVATQAAEIQQQQSDTALANMLEGQLALGYGGGGATALAQAAAKSKQGIAANIEQQEVQNQKLRAQGEEKINQQKLQLEQMAIGAEQQAWQMAENREIFDINRLQAEADFLRNQQQAYADAQTAAWMQGVSGATSVASSAAGSGAFENMQF